MGVYFLAIFVAIPIIEIAVFIQAGELIGLWPTIGVVILTAIIGTSLMRAQGLQTLAKAQSQMDQGEMPIGAMFDGICILIAGVLLLTPGFVTDTMGFLLLVPPLRQLVGAKVIMKLVQSGNIRTNFGGGRRYGGPDAQQSHRPNGRPGSGPIIDGDFEDISPDDHPNQGNSNAASSTGPKDPSNEDDENDGNDGDNNNGSRTLPPHTSS